MDLSGGNAAWRSYSLVGPRLSGSLATAFFGDVFLLKPLFWAMETGLFGSWNGNMKLFLFFLRNFFEGVMKGRGKYVQQNFKGQFFWNVAVVVSTCIGLLPQKESILFQPSIFMGLVSGRVSTWGCLNPAVFFKDFGLCKYQQPEPAEGGPGNRSEKNTRSKRGYWDVHGT